MDYNNYWKTEKNFAIASLVCGIVATVLCCLGTFSAALGALAVLFAVLSHRKRRPFHSMATAGMVLGFIGIFLGLTLSLFSSVLSETSSYRDILDDAYEQEFNQDFGAF